MRLSARNQLNATIDTVQLGEVMSTVKVTLPDGQHLTAAITRDSAEERLAHVWYSTKGA